MRVSSIGTQAKSLKEVLELAKKSAVVTHNHPEGIKGAQAVAVCVFLAFHGFSKDKIKKYIIKKFDYDLDRDIDTIREVYEFDASCQGSVPEAIIAFLESTDFESAVRLAVSLGGDADTQASIAGAISAAYYKDIPKKIIDSTIKYIYEDDRLANIFDQFNQIHSEPMYEQVFVADDDTWVDCYIRYTFALAVTDTTTILLPKGTEMEFDENETEQRYYCHITKGKDKVFKLIESRLREQYQEIDSKEYPELCNGIMIWVPFCDCSKFRIGYNVDVMDKTKSQFTYIIAWLAMLF